MVILTADSRNLVIGAKYSYLTTNYASAVSSIVVTNGTNFAANDFVLLGEIGNETTEVRKIISVTTNTLALTAATGFAHAESTKVAVIPYDQVRFFFTTTTTFDELNPLTSYAGITPDDWFTRYTDTTHTTGYGWFKFKNSHTGATTGASNYIPYANFGRDTVNKLIEGFYTLLNNNEQKIISVTDALEWANEAYDITKNDLALNNLEYDASDGTTSFSVVSGTAEYALATNFGEMIAVWRDDTGEPILPTDITQVDRINNANSGNTTVNWFLRGLYIGITPVPSDSYTVKYRYSKTAASLTAYTDVIDLPKKAFYNLKNFLLYRAKIKLRQADANSFYELFNANVEKMRIQSVNRDNSVDSWSRSSSANV